MSLEIGADSANLQGQADFSQGYLVHSPVLEKAVHGEVTAMEEPLLPFSLSD